MHYTCLHLADIKTQDELERQELLVGVAEDTEPLKALLDGLLSTEDKPVSDADDSVEETVEEELVPDTLEETAAPDAEDTEGISPANGGDELEVGDCHCSGWRGGD